MSGTNLNASKLTPRTHEGGVAERQSALTELERAVSTCLLWEPTFYEKGHDIAQRITELCSRVAPEDIAKLAIRARNDLKLRHVPLWLARCLTVVAKGKMVGDTIAAVIQRPDELAEFLSLYWLDDPEQPLTKQAKRGLAMAFTKFNEYQLAKWNQAKAIKLRDVLFLCHAKPTSVEQATLWARMANKTFYPAKIQEAYNLGAYKSLSAPDTWEVALSGGADKRVTWERLLSEKKLGYIALLMNLRNMTEARVDRGLVEQAILSGAPRSKALPFRFINAAKHAPGYAEALSSAMLSVPLPRLEGETAIVIDVSGSMDHPVSGKSQLMRWEAGAALAILFRQVADPCRVFTFSDQLVEVGNYRGLPLVNAVHDSQRHALTYLGRALTDLRRIMSSPHRLVVITDEQTHDGIVRAWAAHSYLINVAGYKPGLDTSQGWKRISGWSERVVDWMAVEELGTVPESETED